MRFKKLAVIYGLSVTIKWIPSYKDIKSNEATNRLVNNGAIIALGALNPLIIT
jgi:hypothetical protein